MSHAYSLIAVFNMTDAAGTVHEMYMIRNPWGSNNYNYTWYHGDSNWTPALIAQVPFGFDPTAQANSATGIFLVPSSGMMNAYCFEDMSFGHRISGYSNVWYD